MLNRSGVKTSSFGAPTQILANVELQSSVGCIVPQSLVGSADANGKKIAKAGTPIVVNLANLQADVGAGDASHAYNAVLLHDVDVTDGKANGTALLFGFVNLNRLDSAVQSLITTAQGATGYTPLITFIKA